MTLLNRNYFFKAGICTALAALAVIIVSSFITHPAYLALGAETTRRPEGIIQDLTAGLFEPAAHAPLAAVAGAAAYAFLTLILIYRFFETTDAREILFVALFALSFSFEGIRIIIPLKRVYEFSTFYLLMAFRALIFARYAGIFSLFAASVCAAGLELQKQRNIILVITGTAMIIALGLPIDVLSWDSSLMAVSGYRPMFRLVETSIALVTALSFFVSAYSRGSQEYIFVGIGSLLAFLGRTLLLSADTWITPLPGLLALAAGTWFICVHLHRIYLWL